MSKPPTPLRERLMARINTDGPCWEWTGPTSNGYGVLGEGPRGGRTYKAHRLAYVLLVGPIPADRPHIDHLCRNRACCNPEHLEPVTQAENNRRAFAEHATCPRGHDLPPKTAPGVRRGQCKTCKSAYDRARYAARRAS